MSATSRVPALAPFRIRSFRFQWPADLSTSWAFEMETLILGWYVLVETQSVLWLTVFASLQYTGTLLAPFFGVMADRLGRGNVLCAMRGIYAVLAATLMTFAYAGVLSPVHVFAIAALMGLVRPSDMGMRAALVSDTMPVAHLMGAMSIQRTTGDSARIAGALTGAGLLALFGMGPAYTGIAALYAISFVLTLRVARAGSARPAPEVSSPPPPVTSPWRDVRNAAEYVWTTPLLLAAMCLAFLVNFLAYPLVNALMPYVAKEVYGTDQTGLGYLVASFAFGALFGSIMLSRRGSALPAARMMVIFCMAWYVMILIFAQMRDPLAGMFVLVFAGFAQSLAMVPMNTMMLRHSDERFRGRVMGLRMLAIYGLPIGLLISGPLITHFGYPLTATLYSTVGLVFTMLIALHWRAHVWRLDAPANVR